MYINMKIFKKALDVPRMFIPSRCLLLLLKPKGQKLNAGYMIRYMAEV